MLNGASQFPATDHKALCFGGTHSRVYLSKIYPHHHLCFDHWRLQTILYHEIPIVATSLFIVDKPGFFDSDVWVVLKWLWDGDVEVLSVCHCEAYLVVFHKFDLGGLKDGCPKAFSSPGKASMLVDFSEFTSGFDGFVEALLCSVNAMRVKNRSRVGKGIIDLFGLALGQPNIVFVVVAPMPDKNTSVDIT
jgi:hypothetical protein